MDDPLACLCYLRRKPEEQDQTDPVVKEFYRKIVGLLQYVYSRGVGLLTIGWGKRQAK